MPYTRVQEYPCADENHKAIYESFQSIRHPFILTPGDNDWSDGHWVRIEVDPSNPQLFAVKPQIVPQNASGSRARWRRSPSRTTSAFL